MLFVRSVFTCIVFPLQGDVMLAHYMLAHAVAPNLTENTRHAVYFRTFHRDHPQWQFRHESMKKKFLEFEGLHPLLKN